MAELHDAGIRVSLNGDRLRLEPTRGPIPPPVRQRGTDHKPELVALLVSAEGDMLRTLLDLLIDEGLPGATVAALSVRDLRACDGLPRNALSAFLRALARSQRMAAGRRADGLDARRGMRRMRSRAVVARRACVHHRLPVVLASQGGACDSESACTASQANPGTPTISGDLIVPRARGREGPRAARVEN